MKEQKEKRDQQQNETSGLSQTYNSSSKRVSGQDESIASILSQRLNYSHKQSAVSPNKPFCGCMNSDMHPIRFHLIRFHQRWQRELDQIRFEIRLDVR